MSNTQSIGVFDSGIGGMTVVRALTQHLPHENIVYFGDTARVPYGPKSQQVVREYALQDTDVLLQHNVKLIVIAVIQCPQLHSILYKNERRYRLSA
jgi:glutamate racemase